MTVAELIEILNKCPQDAEVRAFPPEWYCHASIEECDVFYNETDNNVEIG